jgi:hypothetical protein
MVLHVTRVTPVTICNTCGRGVTLVTAFLTYKRTLFMM